MFGKEKAGGGGRVSWESYQLTYMNKFKASHYNVYCMGWRCGIIQAASNLSNSIIIATKAAVLDTSIHSTVHCDCPSIAYKLCLLKLK